MSILSLLTIILFFLYCWGLGYTATSRCSKPHHFWERQAVYLSIGLGVFPILAIVLNALRLPLDWRIFLLLSMAFPLYHLVKKIQKESFAIILSQFQSKLKNKSIISFTTMKFTKIEVSTFLLGIVLAIVAGSLYMYASGAFAYPYLEDEDPWGHAVGAKYVALEKDAYDPPLPGITSAENIDPVLSYIDPYPPAYDVLMGVLHQTSPDLLWTLKFFNALLISLSFLFFYLFAQEFTGDRKKALFATFVLATIPSYLSHFIWAHALTLVLLFPALYALEKTRSDGTWMWPALLVIASIWVSQNLSQPITITIILGIYLAVSSLITGSWEKRGFLALAGGIALSGVWWGLVILRKGFHPFLGYYLGGTEAVTEAAASTAPGQSLLLKIAGALFQPSGSGSRAYTFSDFFFAQKANMINNPIGIGWVICIIVIIAVLVLLWKRSSLVTKEYRWQCITLFLLLYTFWGVNGATFPLSVARGPFRVWMFLAIPLALLVPEGIQQVQKLLPSSFRGLRTILPAIIIMGILLTSGYPKYVHNTSPGWPTSGSFQGGIPEAQAYASWFAALPADTKVFFYAPRDKLAIGWGKMSCAWCPEVMEFRKVILDKNAQQLSQFLRQQDYEYFIVSPRMEAKYFRNEFGEEKTNALLQQRYQEIERSGQFVPVEQNDFFIVFRIVGGESDG